MNRQRPFSIEFSADSGHRLGTRNLTSAEQRHCEQLPTERQRRHYVLGRRAAHAAVRNVLRAGKKANRIVIDSEQGHAPRVLVDGRIDGVSVSISHSSRLAVACAWLSGDPHLQYAGIDLEYIRPNQVAESGYAYSLRERRLLARLPEGPEILGLAGWTVKEAVWKALLAPQSVGPDAIEIQELSLADRCAVAQVKGWLAKQLGDASLRVQTEFVQGPDGPYVLAVAQIERTKGWR